MMSSDVRNASAVGARSATVEKYFTHVVAASTARSSSSTHSRDAIVRSTRRPITGCAASSGQDTTSRTTSRPVDTMSRKLW